MESLLQLTLIRYDEAQMELAECKSIGFKVPINLHNPLPTSMGPTSTIPANLTTSEHYDKVVDLIECSLF